MNPHRNELLALESVELQGSDLCSSEYACVVNTAHRCTVPIRSTCHNSSCSDRKSRVSASGHSTAWVPFKGVMTECSSTWLFSSIRSISI
eukprot:7151145-Prymnesium_polylepis.1